MVRPWICCEDRAKGYAGRLHLHCERKGRVKDNSYSSNLNKWRNELREVQGLSLEMLQHLEEKEEKESAGKVERNDQWGKLGEWCPESKMKKVFPGSGIDQLSQVRWPTGPNVKTTGNMD